MGSETHFTDDGYSGPSFAISGKIMMAAIIVLFGVVLFILCLHIYARWFWGRSLGSSGWRSASSRRRRLAFAGNQDPVRLQRVGLEKSVIEALPVFVYKSESHTDGLECAVCLCEFEENEKARLLPKCNHSFHIECIDMWFDSHSTCPLCRTSAQPDLPSTDPVVVVVVGEASGSGSGENEEVRVSVRVDGNPSETEPTSEPDLCVSCRHEDSLPSPTYPTNVLFWGTQNQINARSSSVKLDQGTSSRKSLEKIVIDIPRRTDSFSSPRFFSDDDQQIYSPSGQSMKSPSTRLRSLKRILSREKRVIPQSPDAGCDNAEQSGQVQS